MNNSGRKEKMEIITNNKPRQLFYLYELDESDKNEILSNNDWVLDHYSEDEIDLVQCFKYRNDWYILDDFISLHNKIWCPNPPEEFKGWHGYFSQGYIGGILIKFVCDYDYESGIIIGRY